jgi:hypothetical protein
MHTLLKTVVIALVLCGTSLCPFGACSSLTPLGSQSEFSHVPASQAVSRSEASALPETVTHLTATQIDSSTAIASASGIAREVSTQEWLGPLASVALSPFFGLACLSGVATYGPEWLQSRSALLGPKSPMNNPMLFWMMLGLTIMTSLPRLTKVSKPLALAAEKIEMYSAVIILLSMKFFGGQAAGVDTGVAIEGDPLLVAGIASLPLDVVVSIASALNIIVINTIKLCIEILVWLIPIPAVDAILEVANKSMCAGLMALYVYSPLLSMLLNLTIFAACCFVFLKVKRRLAYMKELMLMPLLERVFSTPSSSPQHFVGFLTKGALGLPSKSALTMQREGDGTKISMEQRSWFYRKSYAGELVLSECKPGLMSDQMVLKVDESKVTLEVRKGLIQQLQPQPAVAPA